jgi:mannose-6-phosphate isomerase
MMDAMARERVRRPWGWYETLSTGEGYLVKRLWLSPGQRISLQLHHHRCEHWVVVNGGGLLTLGDATVSAERGTTLFVPKGARHRAEAGPAGLEIVEVQRGDPLLETDIERFEDDFGRS